MNHPRLILMLLVFVFCSSETADISAQTADGAAPPKVQLPADPRVWINSRPLSLDSLKGKGVVLYFFEEQCPSCVEKWPGLMEMSAKFEGEPVVFIAVNSGNSRREVESYVNKVRLTWPVIVDPDRSFEAQFGFPEPISLNNIIRIRRIFPDGRLTFASFQTFTAHVQEIADRAEWKVDPKSLPPQSLAAWKEVELGDYQNALPLLKRILKSQDVAVREAAEQLQEVALAEMSALQSEAVQAEENEEIWKAYQLYSRMAAQFKGYEGADVATEKSREYARHEDFKKEQTAFKKLAIAQRYGNQGDERSVKRAVGLLEALVEDYPDTDAAKQAQDILATVNANPPTVP